MTVNPVESAASVTDAATPSTATKVRNLVIVLVAIALSVAVFLGLRTEANTASLASLAKSATPLEVAMANEKPTLIEFYADWCTSCQAMAQDVWDLEQSYGDRTNFVMLNVDNTKWLPEMLQYQVDGIPHFVFMTAGGEAIAHAIGKQPRPVMAANLDALISGQVLPYTQARGSVSAVETPTLPPSSNDDPRSHGSQVVK
jgi:thiol:disulfide interchange protein